jgi:hypothetical protein
MERFARPPSGSVIRKERYSKLSFVDHKVTDPGCFRVAYQSPFGLAAIAMFSTSPDLTNKAGFAAESTAPCG